MKKVALISMALSAAFLTACIVSGGADDAATSRKDAGTVKKDASTTPHDAAVAGTWDPNNYGAPCSGDNECPGGTCMTVFEGGDTACYKKCDTLADCSDFPITSTKLACATGPTSVKICIIASEQNGLCGDPVNATCVGTFDGLCGTDTSGIGFCVRVCNPHNTGTNFDGCRVNGLPPSTCGCAAGEGCSTDLSFNSGTAGDPDGICAPANTTGACGFVTDDSLTACTGGTKCLGLSNTVSTSTCAVPTDAGAANPG